MIITINCHDKFKVSYEWEYADEKRDFIATFGCFIFPFAAAMILAIIYFIGSVL